jgi:hypothetical protein
VKHDRSQNRSQQVIAVKFFGMHVFFGSNRLEVINKKALLPQLLFRLRALYFRQTVVERDE